MNKVTNLWNKNKCLEQQQISRTRTNAKKYNNLENNKKYKEKEQGEQSEEQSKDHVIEALFRFL